MATLRSRLPDFPWDSLAPARQTASAHPGGLVDLSVGTPVDPVPDSIRQALTAGADAPGYPTTVGTPALREGIAAFLAERRGVPGLGVEQVLPTIGSKELVAHLPFQLGLGEGDAVAFPHVAYPTYDVGARLAGAESLTVDIARLAAEGDAAFGDPAAAARVRLLWLNSPGNPTGEVLDVAQLRGLVAWARERGAVIASDECYALLPWEVAEAPSVLDPRVTDGDLSGLLMAYSLSKQSNLAGYRAAFLAGDAGLIDDLTLVRKQSGMIVPGPVQEATVTALADHAAADAQRELYRARRAVLRGAVTTAGGRVDGSVAGLYLWTTFGLSAQETIDRLAGLGILAAPGHFYGIAGSRHVRLSLTASDERIAAGAQRLEAAGGL